MDAKISKKRLGLLLSYDWLKIVGICVAAVLLWSLLFTTLATRATSGQSFDIYFYTGVVFDSDKFSENVLHEKNENGALSYDILTVSSVSLEEKTRDMIMSAHFAAGQGDVMFIADTQPTKDTEGNITAFTGLEQMLRSGNVSYFRWLGTDGNDYDMPTSADSGAKISFKNYFTECETYLNRFYDGDFESGTLNKEKVKSNFDERMEKDKRYKNDTQKAEGLRKEEERIENLRAAYLNVKTWVNTEGGPVQVRTKNIDVDYDGNGTVDDTLALSFAFDLSNIKNLTKILGRAAGEGEIEGVSAGTTVKNDLCMAVLSTGCREEEDLRFEPFTLLNYLVETYNK